MTAAILTAAVLRHRRRRGKGEACVHVGRKVGEGEEGDGRCSPKREQVNPATVVVPRTVRRGTVEATVDSLIGIAPLMTRNPFYATRARR